MAKQPLKAAVALSSTGELLLDVAPSIPLPLVRRFSSEAGLGGVPFVGIPLKPGEKAALLAALDDAAAEACAKLLARRSALKRPPSNHSAANIPPQHSRAIGKKKSQR